MCKNTEVIIWSSGQAFTIKKKKADLPDNSLCLQGREESSLQGKNANGMARETKQAALLTNKFFKKQSRFKQQGKQQTEVKNILFNIVEAKEICISLLLGKGENANLVNNAETIHIFIVLGKVYGNISVSNEDIKVLFNLQITEGYIKWLLKRLIFLN